MFGKRKTVLISGDTHNLGDETAYNMRYAKNSKHKPILGCGVVIEGEQPVFVPML